MSRIAGAPKWMLFLLWPFKGESCYPQVEGDLSEEFQYQESKVGMAAARRWYRREVFRNLASLTFRWTTIAAIALPLFCVALSSIHLFVHFLRFLIPILQWFLPEDLTAQILLLLLLSTIVAGFTYAMICNILLRGHERMVRLVFAACYLSLATVWVIKYPTALTKFLLYPVAIGFMEPLLILAFIWVGSIWFERHRGRKTRVIQVAQ
jgi:hypothetical protein